VCLLRWCFWCFCLGLWVLGGCVWGILLGVIFLIVLRIYFPLLNEGLFLLQHYYFSPVTTLLYVSFVLLFAGFLLCLCCLDAV